MSLRILLIAAAALSCCCCCTRADVATINEAAPQDLLLPFNDLLPPLADADTTSTTFASIYTAGTTTTLPPKRITVKTTTTTTTAAATSATKPTKKSYYQQQNKSNVKQQQQATTVNPKPQAQQQQQQKPEAFILSQDLLPPFVDTVTTTERPKTVSSSTTLPAIKLAKQHSAQASRQHAVKVPATYQQTKNVYKQAATVKQSAKVLYRNSVAQQHAASSDETLQHYFNHYQRTTRRPARPLPTLTPFPHHVKDLINKH